jgi:hypothetical protein
MRLAERSSAFVVSLKTEHICFAATSVTGGIIMLVLVCLKISNLKKLNTNVSGVLLEMESSRPPHKQPIMTKNHRMISIAIK